MNQIRQISIPDAYNAGISNYQNGALKKALLIFSKIIKADPNHASSHHMLGVIAANTNQYEAASKAMSEAVRLQPNNPEFLSNFVEVLRKVNKSEEAIEIGKRAVKANPNKANAHSNLGLAFYDCEDLIEAEASQRRAIALNPDYDHALNNLGSIAFDNEEYDEAIKYYRAALNVNPSSIEFSNNLIIALIQNENLSDAREIVNSAIKLQPNNSKLQNNIGKLALLENDLDAAEVAFRSSISSSDDEPDAYLGLSKVMYKKGQPQLSLIEAEKALRLKPESALAHYQIGKAQADLGDIEAGFLHYEKSIKIKPDMYASKMEIGHLHMEQGDFDKARTIFQEVSEASSEVINAHCALARLDKMTPENPAFLALEAELPNVDEFNPEKAIGFHYAIGKAYEDLKQYENAFNHFEKGANKKRGIIKYDADALDKSTDEMIKSFDKEMILKLRKSAVLSDQSIFVVGMPRSGTTLTESILDSHTRIMGAGELHQLRSLFMKGHNLDILDKSLNDDTVEITRKIESYLNYTKELAQDTPHVVDKMPANFQLIGLIHALMPNAKIIHIARNPFDTCLSNFTRLFGRSQLHSYDQIELGRFFNNYVRLMNHWKNLLPDGSFHTVHYENLVDDIDVEARKIISFCGLEWDENCLEFYNSKRRVRTASVSQVRKPLYNSSKEKWKVYENQLQPLVSTIGNNRIKF